MPLERLCDCRASATWRGSFRTLPFCWASFLGAFKWLVAITHPENMLVNQKPSSPGVVENAKMFETTNQFFRNILEGGWTTGNLESWMCQGIQYLAVSLLSSSLGPVSSLDTSLLCSQGWFFLCEAKRSSLFWETMQLVFAHLPLVFESVYYKVSK